MDANLNRAREGMRVCEEIARFILSDAALTRRCEKVRHTIGRISRLLPPPAFLKTRDVHRDAGRPSLRRIRSGHKLYQDLLTANARRVEESVRVLEEFSRLWSLQQARRWTRLRFEVYDIEQSICAHLSSLRHR